MSDVSRKEWRGKRQCIDFHLHKHLCMLTRCVSYDREGQTGTAEGHRNKAINEIK